MAKDKGGDFELDVEVRVEPRPRRVIVEAVAWDGLALHSSVPFLPGFPASDNREWLDIAVSVYDTAYSASLLEPEIGGPIRGLTEDDFEVTVIRGLAGGVQEVRLREVHEVGSFYRLRVHPSPGSAVWGAGHVMFGVSVYSRERDVQGQTVCAGHVYRLPASEASPEPPEAF